MSQPAQYSELSIPESFVGTETHGRVRLLRLNRPKALNALCQKLVSDLNTALQIAEADETIGAIVLTGSEKAFAAGADIREMRDLSFANVALNDFIAPWEYIRQCKKPILAAVRGYALGGGCELAMMCDIVYASTSAVFSQPEITIGTMPGAGGTQRLTQLVGKTKAMDLCLTGRSFTATDAERWGLVAQLFPDDAVLDETLKAAEKIASFSQPVVQMIKESVNHASETLLQNGIRFERRLFHSTFALEDRTEGMQAFTEKRQATFAHR